MDDIINAVAAEMPPFNEYLLHDFTKQQLDGSADYIEVVFKEAVRLYSGAIKYVSKTTLAPEERAVFELERAGASITVSELQLVAYHFEFDAQLMKPVHIYVPYLKDGVLTIADKKYAVQRGIVEQVFSRGDDGVTVRMMQGPLRFMRRDTFKLESAVDGSFTSEFVITVSLWRGRSRAKRPANATAVHYLVAHFGFTTAMQRLGVEDGAFQFVDRIGNDTEQYDYFVAKKASRVNDVYLKVDRAVLANPLMRRLVANLLYTLTAFTRHTVADLYEPTGHFWRVFLGIILTGASSDARARADMDNHLHSVSCFLDPLSRKRFASFGVQVKDIYELIEYVFVQLGYIMVHSTHQDLYSKRIDALEGVLIQPVVRPIYRRFYTPDQNTTRLQHKDVAALLRLRPMMITAIHRSPNVIPSPSVYNDSWLTACGIHKIRQSNMARGEPNPSAPDSRFHPSNLVVESAVAFSGQSPGITGAINPHLQITPEGGVIRPPYAEDIDALLPYLPFR